MSTADILKFAADPDRAWDVVKHKQKVDKVPPITANKPPGHTRFVCISGKSLFGRMIILV